MKAEEARQLSQRFKVENEGVQVWVDFIKAKIKDAALNHGQYIINHPFHGGTHHPSEQMKDAVYLRLQNDGYKVTHHPDPDPGHPASSAYTSIEW